MERVYSPDGPIDGQILLKKDEAHHLIKVRRCRSGDSVVAFNGRGEAWHCLVMDHDRQSVVLRVTGVVARQDPEPRKKLIIATAVPKGERFDWLIEKATELGVSELVPLHCERSVVEPRDSKLDRLRRHVIEACKQCGRNDLMEIGSPLDLKQLSERFDSESELLWADQGGEPVSRVVTSQSLAQVSNYVVCIGPEGGWSLTERDWFAMKNWRKIGLGPYILRIETAGVVASSALFQVFMASGFQGE
ncbi:MAG: hypothetical protein RJA81_653 [Planctomycetota bacterium]|jgi:16S rRNA (uracil1498-N3)-methyltransferase